MTSLWQQPVWLLLAVASGVCAAFNGVFAKLTTTALTTSWSHSLASLLSLSPDNKPIEYAIRALFFGLNVVFNIIMWTLFTAALTRATSTTRVSIINVSANFTATAFLGAAIFGEKLPALWWVGAGLLAGGNVAIGRREEKETKKGGEEEGAEEEPLIAQQGGEAGADEVGGVDLIDLDGQVAGDVGRGERASDALRRGEQADAPI